MPSMPRSVRTAILILLILTAYFVYRGIMRETPELVSAEPSGLEMALGEIRPEVVIRQVSSQPHQILTVLKGRTEPDRTVIVRSETAAIVSDAPVREGQQVRRGQVLCGLNVESRAARLAEAEAAVTSARLEHQSAQALEAKGWTTSNRAAATKASLDRAEAALSAARIELSKTRLEAPFSGIFERRMAEIGDFLSPGAACGEVVDLDPIVIVVEATEQQVDSLKLQTAVAARLSNDRLIDGRIRYIARTANPQTRTFRVEIAAPNPQADIAAGLTASVELSLGTTSAVLLSPASLVLHDDGRVGVRYVDAQDIIRFAAVEIVDDSPSGIWVSGLPDPVRLLSTGQDYLREGLSVIPRPEGS